MTFVHPSVLSCTKSSRKNNFLAEDIKDAAGRGEHFAVFRIENVNRLGISPGKGRIVPPLRLSAPEEIIAPAALGRAEQGRAGQSRAIQDLQA